MGRERERERREGGKAGEGVRRSEIGRECDTGGEKEGREGRRGKSRINNPGLLGFKSGSKNAYLAETTEA